MISPIMTAAVSADLSDPLTLLATADALEEGGDDLLARDYRALAGLVQQQPWLEVDLNRVTHAGQLANRLLTCRQRCRHRDGWPHHDTYHRCLATARQQHGWYTDSAVCFEMQPRERADLRRRVSAAGEPFPIERLLFSLRPAARLHLGDGCTTSRFGRLIRLDGLREPRWFQATFYGLFVRRYPLASFYASDVSDNTVVVIDPGRVRPVGYFHAIM